jgi:hypothetical protein
VSRLGAFFNVIERVSWYPSIPLMKRAVFREPRPTKYGRSVTIRRIALSPTRPHADTPLEASSRAVV